MSEPQTLEGRKWLPAFSASKFGEDNARSRILAIEAEAIAQERERLAGGGWLKHAEFCDWAEDGDACSCGLSALLQGADR